MQFQESLVYYNLNANLPVKFPRSGFSRPQDFMGILSIGTLKRLLMESTVTHATRVIGAIDMASSKQGKLVYPECITYVSARQPSPIVDGPPNLAKELCEGSLKLNGLHRNLKSLNDQKIRLNKNQTLWRTRTFFLYINHSKITKLGVVKVLF
jgi:hypothetical protein